MMLHENAQNQYQSPQEVNDPPKQPQINDSPLHVFDKSYEQSLTLQANNFELSRADDKNIQSPQNPKPTLKLLDIDQSSLALADIMEGELKSSPPFIIAQEKYIDQEAYEESELASVNTEQEKWYSHKFKNIEYKKRDSHQKSQQKYIKLYQSKYQYLEDEDFVQPHYKISSLSLNAALPIESIRFYEENMKDKTKNLILTIPTNSKSKVKLEENVNLPKNEHMLSLELTSCEEGKTLFGMVCDSDSCKTDLMLYDKNGRKSGFANMIIKQVAGAGIQTLETLNQIEQENQKQLDCEHLHKYQIQNELLSSKKEEQVIANQIPLKPKNQESFFIQQNQSLKSSTHHLLINNSTLKIDLDSLPKLDQKTLRLLEQEDCDIHASILVNKRVKYVAKNYGSSDSNKDKSDDQPKQEDISYLIKSTQEQISAYRYPFSPQPMSYEKKRKVNLFSFDFIRKPINSVVSDEKVNSINLSMCLDKYTNLTNLTNIKQEKPQIIQEKIDYGMNTHESRKESRNIREKYSFSESQKFRYSNNDLQKSIVETVPQHLDSTKRNRQKLFQKLDESSSKMEEQIASSSVNNRQNANSTAIFCDQIIEGHSKNTKSQKQFDLMLKNININLHRKVYGRKYARVSINETVYQAESMNGNNLLWADKGYIFKRIKMKDILHLDLFNQRSQASENIGKVSIQVKQLLLANKESYFQTFLINQREIAAVALLGFQIIKKSYSLPSKVTKFSKIDDSRYMHNNSESLSRKKYSRKLSNGTQIEKSSKLFPAIDNKNNVYDEDFYGKKIESRVNPIRIRKFIGGKNIKIPKASRFIDKTSKEMPGPGEYEIESSFSRHTLKQL